MDIFDKQTIERYIVPEMTSKGHSHSSAMSPSLDRL